jgi:hypothetical protein
MVLAEAVFAVSLVGLAILLVFNLFPTASFAMRRAQREAVARNLAISGLEEARSEAFEDLVEGRDEIAAVDCDGIHFQRFREVFVPSPDDAEHLKGISVTVAWREREIDHNVVLEAYVDDLPR